MWSMIEIDQLQRITQNSSLKSNKLPPFLGRNSKKIHKGFILEMWIKIEIDQLQTITWSSFDSSDENWMDSEIKQITSISREKVHKLFILMTSKV